MSDHREEHVDLCAGYALGSLDEPDRRRLEEHLTGGCDACAAALTRFSDSVVLVAASAPPVRPIPVLRQRVLSAVAAAGRSVPVQKPAEERARAPQVEPRRARGRAPAWLWATGAAALAVTSGILWSEAERLRSRLEADRRELTALGSRLAEERRLNDLLAAPSGRVAALDRMPAGDSSLQGRAIYDPITRTAVVVLQNLRAPTGHDYQLWAIHAEGPSSLGLIHSDRSGRAVVRLEQLGDAAALSALAVSLEPAGGSPSVAAPSGPVVMLGRVSW